MGTLYDAAVLADSPVGYWNGTSSGTTLLDVSRHGFNGTASGGVTFGAVGPWANCPGIAFDGTSGGITVPATALLNITGTALTLEAWVYPTALSGLQSVISKWDSDGVADEQYAMALDGSQVIGALGTIDENGHLIGPDLIAGEWVHMAFTYNGTTESVYQHGLLVGTAAVSGAIACTTPPPLTFGVQPTGGPRYFGGSMTALAVYAAALSPARIMAHHLAAVQEGAPRKSVPYIVGQNTAI